MNSKSIVVFVLISLIQFIMSCCGGLETLPYEVEYQSISITPLNTSGFYEMEVKDTVYRNAFGLRLYAEFEPQEISYFHKNFGFSTSLACSGGGPIYNYVDPIDYAEIYLTDISDNKQQNVTNLFGAFEYYDKLISLPEYFATREEWENEFQFELVEFDSIPSSAIFTVYLYMESGAMLSESTQQINFYN